MLIVSKFSDYYDSVAKAGVDKTLVFNRLIKYFKESVSANHHLRHKGGITLLSEYDKDQFDSYKELKSPKVEIELPEVKSYEDDIFREKPLHYKGVLLFCGKAHPYCVVESYTPNSIFCNTQRNIFYEEKPALDTLIKSFEYARKNDLSTYRYDQWHIDRTLELVKKGDKLKKMIPSIEWWTPQRVLKIHQTFKSPIINIRGTIIVNPCLKDLQFQKVVDPYTAFQEISMFIGGVLGNPEKETLSITDKDRIQQHGFDKWSFRKLPEGK